MFYYEYWNPPEFNRKYREKEHKLQRVSNAYNFLQDRLRELNQDYCYRLGAPRDADQYVLKRAYLIKARIHHPDGNPQRREAAEKKFQEISEAYQILCDGRTRDRYGRDALSLKIDRYKGGSIIVLRWIKDARVMVPVMFFLSFFDSANINRK